MGLFEHWPYTNYHDLNLDWIIQKLKDIEQEYEALDIDAVRASIAELQAGMRAASADISALDSDVDTLQAMYGELQTLLDRIMAILEDVEVNPNIGYMQNQTLTSDALAVIYNAMQSYQTNAWNIAGRNIEYGNYRTNNPQGIHGSPLDPAGTYTSRDRLDCSSFVLLSLMGVPFSAAFAGDITPRTTFSRQYKTKPTRNPDGLIRWASDIYDMAESEGMLFEIGNGSQLRTGDVVFWRYTDETWNNLPDDSFAKVDGGAYKHVAHVGMIVADCTAFESGIGLMHCVNAANVMAFQDLESYSPQSLERVEYAFRPRKVYALAEPILSGFVTLRKTSQAFNYALDSHAISFSGGRIPGNYTNVGLNETTGADDPSKTSRITTPMLPFNPALVIENSLSPDTAYIAYYFNSAGELLTTSNNTILRPGAPQAAQIRLEFFNTLTTSGALTSAQIAYLLANVIIRYHVMADSYTQKNAGSAGNADADTFYYLTGVNLHTLVSV